MVEPSEFDLRQRVNTLVTTRMESFGISPRDWRVVIQQPGRLPYDNLIMDAYDEISATYHFLGDDVSHNPKYNYIVGRKTYVVEVYAMVDNVRVVLFSREI